MSVRLWPVLPKDDEDNGLTRVEQMFTRDPNAEVIVVGRLGRRSLNIDDNADGEQIPTLKFLSIEPVLVAEDADTAAALLQAAFRKRTSAGTLDEFDGDDANDDADGGSPVRHLHAADSDSSEPDDD